MSRLDYDVVFYRVFCITLLVTAFTFTVIITNVFIDIDGLLSKKEKYTPEVSEVPETMINELHNSSPNDEFKTVVSHEEDNYDSEVNPLYRTKRSIEFKNGIQVKNPAIKKILTTRLANLLEELDEETKKEEILEVTTVKEFKSVDEENKDQAQGIRNDDLLHLAMHNILLQGLIGHMDLNDVYKKVHILVNNFNKDVNNKDTYGKRIKTLKDIINSNEMSKQSRYNEEHKFFEEIVKCRELKDQIEQDKIINKYNTTNNDVKKKKDNKVYIDTLIEIYDNNQKLNIDNNTKFDKNIEASIKLIYNGKSIKINQSDQDPKIKNEKNTSLSEQQSSKSNENKLGDFFRSKKILFSESTQNNQKPLFDQVFEEYLKKHSLPNYGGLHNSEEIKNIEAHRLKRQIKIRYFDNVTRSKTKLSDMIKKDDDDLYIEIETHFDGKGIKTEKKKKLVKNLIDKIQKALHSDIQEKPEDIEHIKFVKRLQDPIISKKKAIYLNTMSSSFIPVEQRQLDPIGKSLNNHENIAHVLGDTWKKQIYGPNFLSASKSVNSAEMRELNIDYDSVLRNGMSKRLQKPLNIETKDDETNNNNLLDANKNNVTLFLKNIDGTGFSIGFNQYVGEPPDSESMKMFTGVENLIKEYHKNYDQEEISNESAIDKVNNFVELNHGIAKRNVENLHKILTRSVTRIGTNYHTNKYKIFLQKHILPLKKYSNLLNYSDYESILNFTTNETRNNNITPTKNMSVKELPITLDEIVRRKKNKSPEILTLNNILNRKKRSLNVKKISSLKSKIKLNRYLNTKTMANKKIFLKNKRNKRQVHKIRIIAKDKSQALPLINSDENIFLISRENSNTHKEINIMSDMQPPETIKESKSRVQDDEESPFSNIYRLQSPHLQSVFSENLYNDNMRSNLLMSKYPHIFINERSWSKEEDYGKDEKPYIPNIKPYRIQSTLEQNSRLKGLEMTTEAPKTAFRNADMPKVDEIVNAIMPPLSNSNYKVTLKISPQNRTNIDAGFKEVHTTVNKSFDENGLRYFSLLNVSQISKVEKLNKTNFEHEEMHLDDQLKEEKNQLNALLRLHKNKVDVQLNTLLRESKHLEKLIELNKNNNKNKTLTLIPDVIKTVPMSDLRYYNVSGSMKKLSDFSNKTNNLITTIKSIKQLKPTTMAPKIDTDKLKLLDTIKRNEKITLEILNKIDTNTHILKAFLQKFSEKFDSNKAINMPTTEKLPKNTTIEVKLDLTKDWKIYESRQDPFFLSNELKNDTIPFVYAYQQNIPLKNWTHPQGLASIVYHGHIHTNPVLLESDNKLVKAANPQTKSNINTDNGRRKFNESKFFIDEIDHFKVNQNNHPVVRANIKINTTAA